MAEDRKKVGIALLIAGAAAAGTAVAVAAAKPPKPPAPPAGEAPKGELSLEVTVE